MTTGQHISQDLVQEFVLSAHGNLDRVKELYTEHPGLLNVPWQRFDETALQAASHMGDRAIAEYLLSVGAPLNICAASMLGQRDDVARFLEADPSLATAKGAHGIPVMYHAALSGRTDVADLLVSHSGGEGMDGALHAAIKFGHTGMVAWLLAHGAVYVNVLDFEGKTPLRSAVDKGHTEIADMLRQAGAADNERL